MFRHRIGFLNVMTLCFRLRNPGIHSWELHVVSQAWVATFPDARDVFDFYAGQKDGFYHAAKPECLHHRHRGIYEQAPRIANDAPLAFACIMSERGGVPIDISEGMSASLQLHYEAKGRDTSWKHSMCAAFR